MTTKNTRDAISGWEDEGGATPDRDRARSERESLDASHDSNVRGEHRYPETHQTKDELTTRKVRDRLKRTLGA